MRDTGWWCIYVIVSENFLFLIANEIRAISFRISYSPRMADNDPLRRSRKEENMDDTRSLPSSHVYVTLRSERKKEKNRDVRTSYMIKY